MLETGWSDRTIAAAPEHTIAKLRHAIYAKATARTLEVDVDERLRDLSVATMNAQQQATEHRASIRRARSALLRLQPVQVALRRLLHLDDPERIPQDEP